MRKSEKFSKFLTEQKTTNTSLEQAHNRQIYAKVVLYVSFYSRSEANAATFNVSQTSLSSVKCEHFLSASDTRYLSFKGVTYEKNLEKAIDPSLCHENSNI